MKDLAVIILNWNDENSTLKCIEAIKQWKRINQEIIVVDNHSDDEKIRYSSHPFNTFHLIHNPINGGYSGGINLGIKKAIELDCMYILLLNTDAFISESNLSRLLHCLRRHPEAYIVGPIIKEMDDKKAKYLAGGRDIALNINTRIIMTPNRLESLISDRLYEVDYVPGTVLLVRSRLFDEIELLDERFFFSGEIADLCHRAKTKDKKAFVYPDSNAVHRPDIRSPYFRHVLYPYYNLRNRFLYISKHDFRNKPKLYLKWISFAIRQWTGAMISGKWQKARAIMLALKHGIRGVFGNQNHRFLQLNHD